MTFCRKAAQLIVVVSTAGSTLACERPERARAAGDSDQAFGGSQASAMAAPSEAPGSLISARGMAGIELGMTLEQARRAFPSAKFERTSDGEGIALVEVTLAPGTSVVLWSGEDDPAAPIDWTRQIRMMESFSENLATAEGVRAGSLVADVEKLYGSTQEIQKSEIESREYITFERQPAGLTFRLDYSGVFPDGSSTTTEFAPGARIHSIAISAST